MGRLEKIKRELIEEANKRNLSVLNEQYDKYVLPSDTLVKKVDTGIVIGIKGNEKKQYSYNIKIKDLGVTDVASASLDLPNNKLTIILYIPYGLGGTVDSKLKDKKKDMEKSGISVSRISGGTFERDKQKFVIDLKKNTGVVKGIEKAREGNTFIKLTDDVSLSVTK